MYSLGFKLIRVGWAGWALREISVGSVDYSRLLLIIQGYTFCMARSINNAS